MLPLLSVSPGPPSTFSTAVAPQRKRRLETSRPTRLHCSAVHSLHTAIEDQTLGTPHTRKEEALRAHDPHPPRGMERLDSLSMEMLRMGSHKVVDTLAHSQSSTNMSKSISGASLASSQATQRTKCSSGFSSLAGSVRGSTLSSTTNTPGPRVSSIADPLDSEQQHEPPAGATAALPSPATARGGSKTVLGGVLPTMNGMLRRRARFSGWKTEAVYSELRSTALLAFAGGVACSKGTGGTGTSPSSGGGLANLAAKIMHPQHKQVGEWSWSVDLAGAERVLELPALSKRDTFAFAVEFPTSLKKKAVVLAADTAPARKGWMEAMDRARRSVHPQVSERVPYAVLFAVCVCASVCLYVYYCVFCSCFCLWQKKCKMEHTWAK